MTMMLKPQRGEIWQVNFEPTLGAEIRKTRPAIVVSANAIGKLPLKLVVPITDWKTNFTPNLWHICIEPNPINGLRKTSAADILQLRSVDIQRFVRCLGTLNDNQMQDIIEAIALVIQYLPDVIGED